MEEATPATMSNRSYILALPPELHLEIFKHLHPVSSTCLGLTCKEFYPIHRQLHGAVSLQATIPVSPRNYYFGGFAWLGALLSTWAGPKFFFRPWNARFTKRPNIEQESKKESGNGEEE